MRKLFVLVALLVACLPLLHVAAQTSSTDPAVTKALGYMRTQQQADGTFQGFGAGSTADAILALIAAGENPTTFKNTGGTASDGLHKLAPAVITDAGKNPAVAAKFLIAAVQAGDTALAGDIFKSISTTHTDPSGRFGADSTTQAFVLLAYNLFDKTAVTTPAVAVLKQLQLPDGGWSFDGTAATGSDTNTTAVALQALLAVEGKSENVVKALAYLQKQQNADGGFPYSQSSQYGNASDANSTAYVIQGLVAAGEDLANWSKSNKTPLDRLRAFQNTSGAFRFQDTPPDDNPGATYQAVPALLLQSFVPAPQAQPGATGVAGTAQATGTANTIAGPTATPALTLTATIAVVPTVAVTTTSIVATTVPTTTAPYPVTTVLPGTTEVPTPTAVSGPPNTLPGTGYELPWRWLLLVSGGLLLLGLRFRTLGRRSVRKQR